MDRTEIDETIVRAVATAGRKLDRRRFLGIVSKGIAGGLAMVVVGVDAKDAFAAGTCFPPGGRYCSGCGSDATCPTGYITCTPSTDFGCGVCPYTSGWWYSSCTGGTKYKCRDCRILYCPCTCAPNYIGFCGCHSLFSC